MLRVMRKEAKKKMAALTSELSTLQGHLDCLNKRIKTVESSRENDTPSASPPEDFEMEVVD